MERQIAHVALFAALIAALGLVPAFNLPFGVPITAQSLGVMLAGAVLGAKRGAAAVLLFLLLVAMGLPLLAGGRGGLGVFASPTVGFLVGFPVAAFLTGLFVERVPLRSPGLAATIGAILGGVVALHLCGAAGLTVKLDKTFLESLTLTASFLPGDLLKAIVTGVLVSGLAKVRPQSLLWLLGRGESAGARW